MSANHSNGEQATYGKTDSRFIGVHRSNLKSDLIEITEDKLENILMKHESKLGLKKAWIAPLGLLLTIVATLISAEFKDALGVPKATWSAFFILAALLSAVWLVASVVRLVMGRKECSIDALIAQVKNSSGEPPVT
ncbi:MAG: hypothetical protein JKY56_12915 [Kofleriaceae bacterium]|nr:hypothetical protein [Kofleriaceae bacterium]